MNAHELSKILFICAGLNYVILFVWFVALVFGHDRLYQLHKRWFRFSEETFDSLHYAGMSIYKIGILLLNLVPAIVLHFPS
jgi:hypothetical protein